MSQNLRCQRCNQPLVHVSSDGDVLLCAPCKVIRAQERRQDAKIARKFDPSATPLLQYGMALSKVSKAAGRKKAK